MGHKVDTIARAALYAIQYQFPDSEESVENLGTQFLLTLTEARRVLAYSTGREKDAELSRAIGRITANVKKNREREQALIQQAHRHNGRKRQERTLPPIRKVTQANANDKQRQDGLRRLFEGVSKPVAHAALVYQGGIANVFRKDKGRYTRIKQGGFFACEQYVRGLRDAGCAITVHHCDESGDVTLFVHRWQDGPGGMFRKQKQVPYVAEDFVKVVRA